MDIRTELENTVNIKQGKTENINEYTVRLAETVDRETSDEVFEALSLDAKDWMNKAITSYKSHQKLPDLPTLSKIEVSAEITAGQSAVVAQPDVIKTVTADAEIPSKEELNKLVIGNLVAGLKPKKVKKVKKIKEISSSSVIRDVVCQNYNLTRSEIEKILTEKQISFKSELVRNILVYVSATIRTLDSLGLLKNSSLKGLSESAKLRELICSNPKWNISEVKQAVIDQGIKCNTATVSVAFYHIRGTMQSLRKLGMVD